MLQFLRINYVFGRNTTDGTLENQNNTSVYISNSKLWKTKYSSENSFISENVQNRIINIYITNQHSTYLSMYWLYNYSSNVQIFINFK